MNFCNFSREWVGLQATLYLMDQLVTNATVRNELLTKVDYAIVPVANPDGKQHEPKIKFCEAKIAIA